MVRARMNALVARAHVCARSSLAGEIYAGKKLQLGKYILYLRKRRNVTYFDAYLFGQLGSGLYSRFYPQSISSKCVTTLV